LDDLSSGSLDNLEGIGPLTFRRGSILGRFHLASCMRGCSYVFHLAALGSVPGSVAHPALYHSVNTGGTLAVMQMAKDKHVSRVIFAASSSAYGDNPVPWVETMVVKPCSPYAATKVAGEGLLRAFSSSYGRDSVALRYFNVFGPRQSANNAYAAVIAAFAKALLSDQNPTIFGDGKQCRDFTYVHNAVHANLLAARHPGPLGGEVINVGCGRSVSVRTLAGAMAQMLNRTHLAPVHKPERPGDLKYSYADLRRSQQILGYEPIVDFESGLKATVAWYATKANSPALGVQKLPRQTIQVRRLNHHHKKMTPVARTPVATK
jgi:nucleoside-diphosphate-sugar epimerase